MGSSYIPLFGAVKDFLSTLKVFFFERELIKIILSKLALQSGQLMMTQSSL